MSRSSLSEVAIFYLINLHVSRLFWSSDSGVLSQFSHCAPDTKVVYKAVSRFPQCANDLSFWLPGAEAEFSDNDLYDLVRDVGGDLVEQVTLIDRFQHPKTGSVSRCYRIVYRHMTKTLTQDEVTVVHKGIEKEAAERLGVTVR